MSSWPPSDYGNYGDPADWDNEIPMPLVLELVDHLEELGWTVTTYHDGGVELATADGTETAVWMASGGRLWTGRCDESGCRNPVQVHADPHDTKAVAALADREMRSLGLAPVGRERGTSGEC